MKIEFKRQLVYCILIAQSFFVLPLNAEIIWEDVKPPDQKLEDDVSEKLKYEQAARCRFNPPLKKGVTEYTVYLSISDAGGFGLEALIKKNNHIIQRGHFELSQNVVDYLNPAKTFLSCKKNKIILSSQAPFSAATTDFELVWEKGELKMTSDPVGSDPSDEEVERVFRLIERGDYEGACPVKEILYPDRYIQRSTISDLLKKGALAIQKKISNPVKISDFKNLAHRYKSLIETAACLTERVYDAQSSVNDRSKKENLIHQWVQTFGAQTKNLL